MTDHFDQADGRNRLLSMGEPRIVTVSIAADMSAEEVMTEAKKLLRVDPDRVHFRLDCKASGHQRRGLIR